MTPDTRNRLSRLRVLQQLQHAHPNPMGGPLLLQLLLDDDDLVIDIAGLLRSLIWLEDHGLADVQVLDYLGEPITVSRITPLGMDFLSADKGLIHGIIHPSDCLGVQ